MNTATVGLAVTPAVLSTLFSHYLHRKRLRHHPTVQISYDEGLNLIRKFLEYASRHTVEELQAFTSQWVPHPQWVKVDEVEMPADDLSRAASLIQEQLGPEGVRLVGGRDWWQWRKPKTPLKAEWIEMRADYHERKKRAEPGNRVMLYVHGGAYFFGSVDEHRYQIQRHARKLNARAIAPRYRLAPQFPFPCGLHDCLATYLYLLKYQEPSTIILAGDSAGGGMVLSLLVILRDRGIPLPAGAVLISPWVDLTHSFPSVALDSPLDYIPASGFHHKPSRAWPPPNEEDLDQLKKIAVGQKKELGAVDGASNSNSGIPTIGNVADTTTCLSLDIDGETVQIREQIQLYTTNHLISHPLVSPVLQATLGGLPPILIMVGGGEMLRDEQIYLAHKLANPARYPPPDSMMDDQAWEQLRKYKPTDVQLQVWDGLCHVGPTLSFTSPAKYQYRAIAQFGAWALACAQKTEIEILDDDNISVISSNSSLGDGGQSDPSNNLPDEKEKPSQLDEDKDQTEKKPTVETSIGKAGDPLPPFKDHMIRQRVTARGKIFSLPPAEELPACTIEREWIGAVKVGTVRKWLAHKKRWDTKFAKAKRQIHKQRLDEMKIGYEVFGEGEFPPPTALAGRRKIGSLEAESKKARSLGLSLWSFWGSKHDEMTVQREERADREPKGTGDAPVEREGTPSMSDDQRQQRQAERPKFPTSRSQSRRRIVKDESQVEKASGADETTPIAELLALRRKKNDESSAEADQRQRDLLSPNHIPDTGVTGNRPYLDGISLPFSLGKNKNREDNASMMTLTSGMGMDMDRSAAPSVRAETPNPDLELDNGGIRTSRTEGRAFFLTPLASPGLPSPGLASPGERPGLERFVTAQEDIVPTPAPRLE